MTDHAKVIRLHFGRLLPVGHARRELSANIPAGTPLETILEPTYWGHYTNDLKPGDIIEAMCEDGSWEASLRVMFVATGEARAAVRWKVEYEAVVVPVESETHEVKWINVGRKYGVVRKDTGEVIQDKFYPEDEAHKFLAKHLGRLNA